MAEKNNSFGGVAYKNLRPEAQKAMVNRGIRALGAEIPKETEKKAVPKKGSKRMVIGSKRGR